MAWHVKHACTHMLPNLSGVCPHEGGAATLYLCAACATACGAHSNALCVLRNSLADQQGSTTVHHGSSMLFHPRAAGITTVMAVVSCSGCEMTYMYSSYVPIATQAAADVKQRYQLYLYREEGFSRQGVQRLCQLSILGLRSCKSASGQCGCVALILSV